MAGLPLPLGMLLDFSELVSFAIKWSMKKVKMVSGTCLSCRLNKGWVIIIAVIVNFHLVHNLVPLRNTVVEGGTQEWPDSHAYFSEHG